MDKTPYLQIIKIIFFLHKVPIIFCFYVPGHSPFFSKVLSTYYRSNAMIDAEDTDLDNHILSIILILQNTT